VTRLEVEQVPLGDLRPYPGNARRGDVDAIAESLDRNGQFRPLVVQRATSYVLAGNHTLRAAQKLGWPSVQVTYLDVDEEGARRIVLADNRTADLGGYDEHALADLLRELGDDLAGTGFGADDVDDLLASLEEADAADPPQPPTALIPGREPAAGTTRTAPSYAEYAEQYASRATRFLALNYPPAQYDWIIGKLAAVSAEEGVGNSAEAVLRLVEQRTGETAPPLEDGQVIGDVSAPAGQLKEVPAGG
jgi:ParB-like nuclease family protein